MIAVIGGGASGMAAALSASEYTSDIVVFERQARVGRKLLVTGNGRCNLSNSMISTSKYHGEDVSFSAYALETFGREYVVNAFKKLGLVTVEGDRGRIYPLSDSANSVVDSLRLALAARGVKIVTDTEIKSVEKQNTGFCLRTASDTYKADSVIVCCGSRAGARHGGCDLGYLILEELGHTCTPLYPALVQLKTENTFTRSLKGVRCDAAVKLVFDRNILAESTGEVQFTDYGISGPAVFEISGAAARCSGASVVLDLMRGYSRDDIMEMIRNKKDMLRTETFENLLTGMLQNRLGRTVLRYCGYHLSEAIACLYDDDISDIADGIKSFELPLTGTTGFENAQVVSGGIRTSEIDPLTMQSLFVPGLFVSGEVLDIDGDCGGYNLQWAWSSGFLAGYSAAHL